MIAVRPQVLRAMNAEILKKGFILGLLLGGGYITQTIGLEMTTAAITGFVTGLYVVLTPLLAWLLLRETVERKVLIGVALATVGLGLISITGFSVEVGQHLCPDRVAAWRGIAIELGRRFGRRLSGPTER
jgi:drug/metabolite transporter (DMT)-like permease